MAFSLIPLGVIAYSIGAVLVGEILLWLFIYSKPEFKSVMLNLAKHSEKVEAAKDASSTKGLKKREARREKWKEEASKFVASMNFKTSIIVSFHIHLTHRRYPLHFFASSATGLTILTFIACLVVLPSYRVL